MITDRVPVNINELQSGDVICVQRDLRYFHFGIYIGHNKVIHFSGDYPGNESEITGAKIIETSLEKFLKNGQLLKEFNYSECEKFSKDEVVKRAKSFLGSELVFGQPYNFLTNNCEHFASWCATGERKCSQVTNVINKINNFFKR